MYGTTSSNNTSQCWLFRCPPSPLPHTHMHTHTHSYTESEMWFEADILTSKSEAVCLDVCANSNA